MPAAQPAQRKTGKHRRHAASLAQAVDEHRYRKHFLRSDTRNSIIVILIFFVLNPAFILNDLAFLSDRTILTALFAVRGVFAFVSITALVTLWKSGDPVRIDRMVSVWLVSLALLGGVLLYTRLVSGRLIPQGITNAAIVTVVLFALRGPLASRAFFAAFMTAAQALAVVFAAAGENSPVYYTILLCMAGIGAAGTASSARAESNRRELFFLQLSERKVHRQLSREKQRAESLSRAKSDFLATMSHEFRTPMNALMGLSRLLSDALEDPEHRRYAATIQESARALLVNLNDILDFSRIDAGHLDLNPESFDPRLLARSVVELLHGQAARKGLALESSVSERVPAFLLADADRIRQILINLLSNAIKFTEDGSVRFSMDAVPGSGGTLQLVVLVEDTGIGMEAASLSRLFQPFEQIPAGKRKREGTGLGLAICKRLVTGMGGEIEAASAPGKGSRFRFSVRVSPGSPPAPRSEDLRREGNTEIKILLVEDDSVNQLVAFALLKRIGYSAELAENGGEAMDAISRKQYDVVLLDRQLPDMDGMDVARWIRTSKAPHPTVIAVSASTRPEEISSFRAAGIDDFVSKPIDLDALSKALARVTRRHIR